MASLYKKPIVIRDSKTGEKIKTKSKKWWGRYRDITDLERRVPLASDKSSAQAMLNNLVRKVEREKAGLIDPAEKHLTRPISEHIGDFERYLVSKGNTETHCKQTTQYVRKIFDACGFERITDISASLVQVNIAALQREGKGVSTRNHYLRAIKSFTRWLVRDRRTSEDRLMYLSKTNEGNRSPAFATTALSEEEFSLLVCAAQEGALIERIPGYDRVIMYVLAAWTGFRKGELGSMTRRSFQLNTDPSTLTVDACYSKRKRKDTQVLHPGLAEMVTEWLATKPQLRDDDILFPVSAKVPGGVERKTSKMMKLDLAAARKRWISDAETPEERDQRQRSDFLKYCDSAGRYADFHANRHTFISNLTLTGASPKVAQTLARHSDINLTMQTYTHLRQHDQTAAISALPAPPSIPKVPASSEGVRG